MCLPSFFVQACQRTSVIVVFSAGAQRLFFCRSLRSEPPWHCRYFAPYAFTVLLTRPHLVMPLTMSTEATCFRGPPSWICWLLGYCARVWHNEHPQDTSQSAPTDRGGTLSCADIIMVSESAVATVAEDVRLCVLVVVSVEASRVE